MTQQIIGIVVNFIVTGLLGYAVATIKNYRKKNSATNKALKIMLQSNLTNTYFVYNDKKVISDYVYRNWLNMFKEYKELGGNEYVDTLAEKMENWEIVRTDILNN